MFYCSAYIKHAINLDVPMTGIAYNNNNTNSCTAHANYNNSKLEELTKCSLNYYF